MKILKVLEHPDHLALEYEAQPGYPDTYRIAWDELYGQLPKGASKEEAVALAALLLQESLKTDAATEQNAVDLLAIAQQAVEDSDATDV